MSRVAIILSLLVVASLNASVTSIRFFGHQSYKNLSYVQVSCSDYPQEEGRTRCEVKGEIKISPLSTWKNYCTFMLETGRYALRPNSMQVVRFGHFRAILSWEVVSTINILSSWRLGVVHFDKCKLYKPMMIGWKYKPVSIVVHDDTFTVVVYSERDDQCAMPASGRHVPRCAMRFDRKAQPMDKIDVWFVQDERDDNMILEPLEYENSANGHLLIETSNPKTSDSVFAHAYIVKPDGTKLQLDSYEMSDGRSTNPYDDIAYSTANGVIGICIENRNERLICSQFTRNGQKLFEKSLKVERKNQYAVTNVHRLGGMLLLTYICTDPENLCNLVDSVSMSVSRIESSRDTAREVFHRKELYTCNKMFYRGEVQLFERDPGHYCYTQVCLGYPKNYLGDNPPVIFSTCFSEKPTLTYSDPRGYAYFDHYSYKNMTHVTVYCSDRIYRNDGSTLCEVSGYVDRRLKYTCEVWLSSPVLPIKPDSIQVLPFNDNKVILSWQAYASRYRGAWRLQVVHLEDCSSYQPEWTGWFYVPSNIIVYDKWFAAVVTSTMSGPCMMPASGRDITRCTLFFDDQGKLTAGPLIWFLQAERDDNMVLVPLEYENPASGHLLIETTNPKTSDQVFARAYIIQLDGQLMSLGSYELGGNQSSNPHNSIAYSTANGFIGICVETKDEQIICRQFDQRGHQTLEKTIQVGRKHEFAVINLARPGAMLLLHYVCTDPESRCERRNSLVVFVSRIDSDVETPQGVFHSFERYQCDRRFNRASIQLFVNDLGRYCFVQVCYRNPKDQDNFYRPVIFSTCLPERVLEATT